MTFVFETSATMKPYNSKKWWIDSDIIPRMKIDAPTLKEAIKIYAGRCEDKYYITISKTAIRTASPIYYDGEDGQPHECGRCFTASTEFEDDERMEWVKQYIELWANIYIVSSAFGGVESADEQTAEAEDDYLLEAA